jgi:6-phospho-beta-glucosidase
MSRKVAMIGGGGVRTPLVIYGLAQTRDLTGVNELTLFDLDRERTGIIARIGREIVRRSGADLSVTVCPTLESALEGAHFVLNSIRVGGMSARARDERIAIEHGLAGQETTGPGGAAMALRTVPITLSHAHIVERIAPDAWFINFTNPAGLITQALTGNTSLRVVGICDTPMELFHRIATTLGARTDEMQFDYAGLNHLGWVRRVLQKGQDVTASLMDDDDKLKRIYPDGLFDPALIRTLGLLPTEYLFFYYRQRTALANQERAGASRGQELERMNVDLFRSLAAASPVEALETYRAYLQRRNASYMKLESQASSAFATEEQQQEDPFETATGYHRIALEVMTALLSDQPRTIVLNVPNHGAIPDLEPDDVVEVPCEISRNGIVPHQTGPLAESVRGLVLAVKAYERTTIRAALAKSTRLAELALLEYPIIGQWDLACEVLNHLVRNDREHLGYLA